MNTVEEIIETPIMQHPGSNVDETNVQALDWIVQWATKLERQLVFINIHHVDEQSHVHVSVLYTNTK